MWVAKSFKVKQPFYKRFWKSFATMETMKALVLHGGVVVVMRVIAMMSK